MCLYCLFVIVMVDFRGSGMANRDDEEIALCSASESDVVLAIGL